jgi:DNA-binding GntR family transcriptional regulator
MDDVSHERILDAIAARNGPEARRLMSEHILVPDRFFRKSPARR